MSWNKLRSMGSSNNLICHALSTEAPGFWFPSMFTFGSYHPIPKKSCRKKYFISFARFELSPLGSLVLQAQPSPNFDEETWVAAEWSKCHHELVWLTLLLLLLLRWPWSQFFSKNLFLHFFLLFPKQSFSALAKYSCFLTLGRCCSAVVEHTSL